MRLTALATLPWLLLALAASALSREPDPGGAGEGPRLVVLISVDQLIPEQLDRLEPLLDGGLGRFWQRGTAFRNAALDYAMTATGPGHATFATGRLPNKHGLVGNSFHDRALGGDLYCVADPDATMVSSEGLHDTVGSRSPRNLRGPGLSDHLEAAFPGSKTFSISFKDRSAIAMGGHAAELALWWDTGGRGFVTSDHYALELPDWVVEWNDKWIDSAIGWTWEPSFEGDPSRYGTDADDRPGETPRASSGVTFPYPIGDFANSDPVKVPPALAGIVYRTPLGDRFTAEVALRAVDALELGADDVPDLLSVSFSGCDVIGHAFGPYSWEVTDLLLRTDDALGELFAHLDETVGKGRWIAALSADHGVLELPEALAARGVGARRLHSSELAEIRTHVQTAVDAEFPEPPVVARFSSGGWVLDETAVSQAGHDPALVRATIAIAAVELPVVGGAYTLEQLESDEPVDGWISLYRNGFVRERSVDVVMRLQPWLLAGVARGTSHGSPYYYDRRVPLAFFGPGFAVERRYDAVSSTDAVPTLLDALGISLPEDLDGRSLF